MLAGLSRLFRKLRGRGAAYCLRAVAALFITLAVFKMFDGTYRDVLIQHTAGLLFTKGGITPTFAKLVLIGDEEYYRSEPRGRVPLNRRYLARLIRAVDQGEPGAVAIDFDLRTLDPSTDQIPVEYRGETDELVSTIVQVASHRPIVLPKSLNCRNLKVDLPGSFRCELKPDVYDGYGICKELDSCGIWKRELQGPLPWPSRRSFSNISCGYIAPPRDDMQVPGTLPVYPSVADSASSPCGLVDSLALAVAKTRIHTGDRVSLSYGDYYATFISEKNFRHSDFEPVFSAAEVLKHDRNWLKATFQPAGVVIIGGDWSALAYRTGQEVDRHLSPAGRMSGALINANFAEAIVSGRVFRGSRVTHFTPGPLERFVRFLGSIWFEIVIGVVAALAFALCETAASLFLWCGAIFAAILLGFAAMFFFAGRLLFGWPGIAAGMWLHGTFELLENEGRRTALLVALGVLGALSIFAIQGCSSLGARERAEQAAALASRAAERAEVAALRAKQAAAQAEAAASLVTQAASDAEAAADRSEATTAKASAAGGVYFRSRRHKKKGEGGGPDTENPPLGTKESQELRW